MNITFDRLWSKFSKSKKYRDRFVAAQAKRAIPFQIRALMRKKGISQAELAERSGLTQGVISRAADPNYGNLTINTIVKIANGFDVAYLGVYAPFSDLARWFERLSEDSVQVVSFEQENHQHAKFNARLARKVNEKRRERKTRRGLRVVLSVGKILSFHENTVRGLDYQKQARAGSASDVVNDRSQSVAESPMITESANSAGENSYKQEVAVGGKR